MPVHNVWRKIVFLDELATHIAGATDATLASLTSAISGVTDALASKADRVTPINTQTGSYTLTLADANATVRRFVIVNAAGATPVTLPSDATAAIRSARGRGRADRAGAVTWRGVGATRSGLLRARARSVSLGDQGLREHVDRRA